MQPGTSQALTHPSLLITEAQAVDGDVDGDALLVFARGPDGHLEVGQGILAHPVTAGLGHLQDADELRLEAHPFSHKSRGLIFICNREDRQRELRVGGDGLSK